jgi:hypothetical protein
MPATPSFIVAETPSPRYDRSFSQLLQAEMCEADPLPTTRESSSETASEAGLLEENPHPAEQNERCPTGSSTMNEARKQLKYAIEKELGLISKIELKVAEGATLSKVEAAKLKRKANLLLEAEVVARFLGDGAQQLKSQLSESLQARRHSAPAAVEVLPLPTRHLDGGVETVVRNTFIEISPKDTKLAARSSRSLPPRTFRTAS